MQSKSVSERESERERFQGKILTMLTFHLALIGTCLMFFFITLPSPQAYSFDFCNKIINPKLNKPIYYTFLDLRFSHNDRTRPSITLPGCSLIQTSAWGEKKCLRIAYCNHSCFLVIRPILCLTTKEESWSGGWCRRCFLVAIVQYLATYCAIQPICQMQGFTFYIWAFEQMLQSALAYICPISV